MKKVLSFVLILALVLGSFSFAFGLTDVAGTDMEDAIKVNNDLGIIKGFPDGSFKPEQNVNRAEFAAMITRALAIPESALAAYSTTSFKDTSGYGWAVPYLAFCESKGIMIGDGMGNVMPGRTINQNEAITMVVRSLGYTENASVLVGTWPSNYVSVGMDLGLYDDLTNVATVNRANAAQVIYNALTVNKVQVNADGEVKAYDPAATMLDALGADFWQTKGTDNKNAFDVYTTADADTSVINTREYVGAFVKAYVNSDDEVIAIAEVGSTFLTGTYDSTDEEFTANDVDYSVDVAGGNMLTTYKTDVATPVTANAKVGVNGNISVGTSVGSISTATSLTIAVDISGKTIKEVYSVQEWTGETAFLYEADMLDDESINGYDFTLDDNDDIDTESFALFGVNNLGDIAVDNVVSVFLATPLTASTDIVKVEVGTETVTGKVTFINADNDKYTIGGKVYKFTANNNGKPSLGDEGTAYLNYDGKIAYWDEDTAATENYAIVTGELVTVGRDETIKLLDKTGVEKDYVLDAGTTVVSDSGLTVGELVVFDLDKAGKATMVSETALIYGGTDELNKQKTVYGNILVDTGVTVFIWDGSDYSLGAFADVEAETSLTASYAALGGKVKVLVVPDDVAGADSVYAVINSALNAFNADDDEVQYVQGFADNAKYTAYTDDRGVIGAALVTNTSIQVAKLNVNSAGVIVKATAAPSHVTVVKGYVVKKDSNNLIHVGSTSSTGVTWCAIDTNAAVYEFDAAASDWYSKGALSSIKGKTTVTTGTAVELWQLDDDSSIYDLVIIKK